MITSNIDLLQLSAAQFEPLVGELFDVNEQALVLELIEVTRLQSPSPRSEPFSLVFRSSTHRLQQSTFRLTHLQLGSFDLFIVPIEPDANGSKYQAIFN